MIRVFLFRVMKQFQKEIVATVVQHCEYNKIKRGGGGERGKPFFFKKEEARGGEAGG